MNKLISLSLLLIIASCNFKTGRYSEVSTEIDVSSYIDKTYDAEVCVWVRYFDGRAFNLEYYKYIHNVSKEQCDSFVRHHRPEAEYIKARIDSLLATER